MAKELGENEARISEELLASQGSPVDIGSYYILETGLVNKAMRPCTVYKEIIDGM